MAGEEVVERHRGAGRAFEAAGVMSFVREEGAVEAVVCVHGVPSSCFLSTARSSASWRLVACAAFDLPGLGLAERPEDFDCSWSSSGNLT
ncbi:MAG: hypothetical protein ACR2NV_04080 [Thermoleophilaceae bacterium]